MKKPHPRPNLEQLRSMQGSWDFASLEVSGMKLAARRGATEPHATIRPLHDPTLHLAPGGS